MSQQREWSLLTKTAGIYLIFTMVAFAGSALYLTHETNEFINHDVEIQFIKLAHRTKHYLRHDGIPGRKQHFMEASMVSGPIDTTAFPVYTDTLMTNPYTDAREQFRRKSTLLQVNDTTYQATFTKSIEDYLRLRDDIYGSLIPAFILLAVGIVGFNLLLSRSIFRPFNTILDTMKTYSVGGDTAVKPVQTSTREFNRMQRLFRQMLKRIEADYRRLKEYTEDMAHEIQTPLSVVRNKLETVIDDGVVMERQGEAVQAIWHEINHLSKLGKSLNLLTKIENREFADVQTIHTGPVIEQHVQQIEDVAGFQDLEIRLELSQEHTMEMDPYLLDILIKNLLNNALRYSIPEGPVRIRTTEKTLIFSNYGEPLPFPAEKLFERFAHHEEREEALGLGLALVQKICEHNELTITYEYQDRQHFFRIRPKDSGV